METAEIIEACLRMGLIDMDERPAITPLEGGVSSLIARIDTARGPVCFKRALPRLKVASEWLAPVDRNRAEVTWLKVAATIAPEFVPRVLGEDSVGRTFAMEYLDSRDYPVWKEQLRDGHIVPSFAEAVAKQLARVHGGTAGRPDMARTFANDSTFFAIRLDPYFGAALSLHRDLAPVLQQLIDTTLETKRAVVHGDVSPKNILAGLRGPVLLDAECAWYGDPAFDVAFCSTHLMLKCVWRPQFARAYLSCFETFVAAYLAAVNWEPASELEARACRLLAGILLARVDGKSPVEYIVDDVDRERVRRFARRFLLEPARGLTAMRTAWAAEIRA